MKYESTRGKTGKVTGAQAIKAGIAPDGGLYVPSRIAHVDYFKYTKLTYQQKAFEIFRHYLADFSDPELVECIENAYNPENFDDEGIVKIVKINENMNILELWHGPTCAFKDIALQLLPHLLAKSIEKTGEDKEVLILVATSGDTGKAALEGFRDVAGTRIVVFFPKDGVSEVQKLQMVTQQGNNLSVVMVDGNFDDAQNGVKEIFSDPVIREFAGSKNIMFSSANSINWGRLLPQIVYYISAYSEMVRDKTVEDGEKINICIPTGNFGNILAAYYAKLMGLPVNRLICASNENNVLTEFIQTGVYDSNRKFHKTISPSMDILVSSNLERLLYELTGRDHKQISAWMNELKNTGRYEIDEKTKKKVKSLFFAGYSSDSETLVTIRDIYEKFGYLADPHTAVAIDVYDKYIVSTQDMSKTIIASTASPFKFAGSVIQAVASQEEYAGMSESAMLELMAQKTGIKIPAGLKDLDLKEVIHKTVCPKDGMKEYIMKYVGRTGARENT